MTFPLSWPSPMRSVKASALACLLALTFGACASHPLETDPQTKPPKSAREAKREQLGREQVVSSKYEWGVQYYEAGKYQEALDQFRRLAGEGAENPYYAHVPFYVGMSHYHLKQYNEAVPALRHFLQQEEPSSEGQEARLALLSIFERTQDWPSLLGLAAETDRLTLYQDNRAYLKLLWARALAITGEEKGARLELNEAQQYISGDPDLSARLPDYDRDLWGRFHYVGVLLDIEACRNASPKELKHGKIGNRRLYQAWIESTTDCLRNALAFDEKELLARGSFWGGLATDALGQNVDLFGKRLQAYLGEEASRLDQYRALEAISRSNLYRLLASFDEAIQGLKNQSIGPSGLDQIRKRIDNLLLSLSHAA